MDEPTKRAAGAGMEYPEAMAALDGLALDPAFGGAAMEVAYIDDDLRRRMNEAGAVPDAAIFMARSPRFPDGPAAFILDNGKVLRSDAP
jgi:hypothetical protein